MFWNNSEAIIKPIICVVGAIYFDKYVGKYLEKVYSKVKEKLQFNKIREMNSAYN